MNTVYTRFIILSDARTGSNLVQQALNSHANVVCFREIFNLDPAYVDYDADGWDGSSSVDIELRASDPAAFLRARVFCDHPDPIKAVGFKFHYGHFWFHEELLPALTGDSELRVIHLQRRNLLRSLVSFKIAEQTGMWLEHDPLRRRSETLRRKLTWSNLSDAARHPRHAVTRVRTFLAPVNAPPAQERQPVTVTREELLANVQRVNHEIQHFGNLFRDHPTKVITFEELTADRDSAMASVCGFLGVPPAGASTTLRRQNPEPLRELIANYDGLRTSFAGTEYEAWFDD